MKSCFKCGLIKPLGEFYKHPKMSDGHLGKCKACTKADTKARASELLNNPDWVLSEQERHREKYHRLGYKEKHKPTPEVKAVAMRAYIEKYPEKAAARNLSQHIKPSVPGNQLHHWSYRPMHAKDLIEMTPAAHYTAHRVMSYDPSEMMYRTKPDGILLDSRQSHEEWIFSVLSPMRLAA